MNIRTLGIAIISATALCGAAYAQNAGAAGDASGPATGKNVTPHTAVQKDQGNSVGGGAGVEGAAGSKNGPPQKSPHNKKEQK